MPEVITRILRALKVGAVAGVAVGAVRSLRGQRTPPTTGQANWPPLASVPPLEPRTGPVRFADPAPAPSDDTPAAPMRLVGDPAGDDLSDASTTDESDAAEAPGDGQRWVEPVDGVCPVTHPVKGNAGSGIFHVPGGMSYDRTIPERCYATEADAEADGFRKAKR